MSDLKCNLKQDESLIVCDDFGKYAEYEARLWMLFLQAYESGELQFQNTPIRMKHYPPTFSAKTGFYHLICENYQHQDEDSRKPNFRRCERLLWAKTILSYCQNDCPHLLVWENIRHSKHNIILFCPELDYVVVLTKRKKGYLLLTTAYPIDHPHRREDLLFEYKKYKTQTAHRA